MKKIFVALSIALALSILSLSVIAQGQQNYAIVPVVSPVRLPAYSTTNQTLCIVNSGINNSETVTVGTVQTFNIDTLEGVAGTAGAVRLTNPIPVQPIGMGQTATTVGDWTVTQAINTNKVSFNFVSMTDKELPNGTKLCVDVPITTGAAVEARIRFYGSMTTAGPNPPFVSTFVY